VTSLTQPRQRQVTTTNWKVWRSRFSRRIRPIVLILVSLIAIVVTWRSVSLVIAARQPVDAWFVLGGSIKREMYIASQAGSQRSHDDKSEPKSKWSHTPNIPILISTGSKLPCLWAIFNRAGVDLDRVWVEECAMSTFGNFIYSVPILASWNVHHIKLTTSATHAPRATWMARIAFGAWGMWVEFDPAPEIGLPANQESRLKTVLDIARMMAVSIVAPIMPRHCDRLTNLAHVDWSQWLARQDQGVSCEYQAQILSEELPPGIVLEN